ncbi:MAG: secretin N-terminal domain-containing protein [Limnochordia bacterium]
MYRRGVLLLGAVLCIIIVSMSSLAADSGVITDIPVTIDFRDTEVVQIYQILGDLAGLNVITDPSMQGRFTVSLKGEPLNRALDLIAATTGFGYTLSGNTLVVAPPQRLSAFTEREYTVINIKSLAPETVRTLLAAAVPGATVTVDTAQRLALISGTKAQVQEAAKVLEKYDAPAVQEYEFIETSVGEILRSLARTAGLNMMLEGDLSAKLTIYLRDMNASDAIEFVAQAAKLEREETPAGVVIFRQSAPAVIEPVVTESEPEPVVKEASETRLYTLKYISAGNAASLVKAMYPAVDVVAGVETNVVSVTGTSADVAAALALLAQQDFPSLRLAGIVQQGAALRAVLEIDGVSQIVQEGQTIKDLFISELTADSITVRLGERAEVLRAGGTFK